MDFSEILDAFEKERDVIFAAPWSFALAVIAVSALVWWIATLLHRREIDALKATIRTQEERIALIKEKTEASESRRMIFDSKFNQLTQTVGRLNTDDAPSREAVVETTAAAKSAVTELQRFQDELVKYILFPVEDDDPKIGPVTGDYKE